MRRRATVVIVGIVVILAFIFFVPIVPSTFTTNATMPCALEGYPCPLGPITSANPSGMVTYHLESSLSYSEWGMGIVYSPDFGVVWL
jgi:hypothetical protein